MKIQKLPNIAILGSFFLLMMVGVAAGPVEVRVENASECQKVCEMVDACYHYTYCYRHLPGYGICYLKRAEGWTRTEQYAAHCTSGNSQGTTTYTATNYLYGDLSWFEDDLSIEDCQKMCEIVKMCWYYTYCQGLGCYLKKKTGITKIENSQCTSGDHMGRYKLTGIDYNGGDTRSSRDY